MKTATDGISIRAFPVNAALIKAQISLSCHDVKRLGRDEIFTKTVIDKLFINMKEHLHENRIQSATSECGNIIGNSSSVVGDSSCDSTEVR